MPFECFENYRIFGQIIHAQILIFFFLTIKHLYFRMKLILVQATIFSLICVALASEIDNESDQYLSQLSDMGLLHRPETRSGPHSASRQPLNRLPWYELIKKNDDVSRLAMRILKRSKMQVPQAPASRMAQPWFHIPAEY